MKYKTNLNDGQENKVDEHLFEFCSMKKVSKKITSLQLVAGLTLRLRFSLNIKKFISL